MWKTVIKYWLLHTSDQMELKEQAISTETEEKVATVYGRRFTERK